MPKGFQGQFIGCAWVCAVCERRGPGKLWAYPTETRVQTMARWSESTRRQCRIGCGFTVTPRHRPLRVERTEPSPPTATDV